MAFQVINETTFHRRFAKAVDVVDHENPDSFQARRAALEHRLYPEGSSVAYLITLQVLGAAHHPECSHEYAKAAWLLYGCQLLPVTRGEGLEIHD